MIPSNMSDLIKALVEKTKNKKAIWGKTSRPNEFKLSLEKGAITTDCWNDEREGEFVSFAVYNSFGDRIDNYYAEKGQPDFDLLKELHNVAMRDFYKVDETISSLIDEINDEKSIGKRLIDGAAEYPF